MNPHEEELVRTFIEPSRQDRFLEFLGDVKKRWKFSRELAHRKTRLFNPKYIRAIPPNQQSTATLYALLRQLGAPTRCHVISEGTLDGKEAELLDALTEIVGRGMGSLVSCLPGRLAYFESEDERFVLQR